MSYIISKLLQSTKILDRITPGASRSFNWEVLMMLTTFPASILLNRTLGAEQRGLLALVILVPETLFTVGNCQWIKLLKGLITSKQISGKEAWCRSIYYCYLLSIFFVPIGIATSIYFVNIPQEFKITSAVMCIIFPIIFLQRALSSIYIASGMINEQYYMVIVRQISYVFLVFIAIIIGQLSIKSMSLIYMLMYLFSFLFGFVRRKKIIGEVLDERPSLTILGKGFIPYSLKTLSQRTDILAFSTFGSLSALGSYKAMTAMMTPVGLVSNALSSGSTACLDWTNDYAVNRYLKKTTIILLSLLFILCISGNLVGQYLLELVLGKSFHDSSWMISWISCVVVCRAADSQFHEALQLSGFGNYYLIIQTIELFLNLFLVVLLGWCFAERGIFAGIIITSITKSFICFTLTRQNQ